MIEDLIARLIEKVEGRFYGKYRAFVVDNADPENRGRLKLRIPSVLGDEVVSGWALPCSPYGGAADQGFFFIPENEAGVWAEFEAGLLEYPIWVGAFWSKPGGTTEVPKPADAQSPPTRKMIKTLKGSSIEIEDKDDEEVFIIQYKLGDKKNTITMNKDGVLIVDANKNTITMNDKGVLVEDANDNKITMDKDDGVLVEHDKKRITMNDDGVIVEDGNDNKITMKSSSVTIEGKQIKIGGDDASEPLVRGNKLDLALQTWVSAVFNSHMHTGNLGAPTTPPLVPGTAPVLTSALSQTNTVK